MQESWLLENGHMFAIPASSIPPKFAPRVLIHLQLMGVLLMLLPDTQEVRKHEKVGARERKVRGQRWAKDGKRNQGKHETHQRKQRRGGGQECCVVEQKKEKKKNQERKERSRGR